MRKLIYFVAVLLGCVLITSITSSWTSVIPRVVGGFLSGFVITWIALELYYNGEGK